MNIDLILSDDWELRGDGSGDMGAIQFATARQLMDIYERHDLRGTFNVEVMQQLGHREWGDRYPHLAVLANQWDECVREMHARGHDVQLHVHPQWWNAVHDGDGWQLNDNWSIVDYPEADARQMLFACRDYLTGLIRQDDPDYRCRSFRSGSWSLAPSPFMLSLLAELGLDFDMSIGQGLHYDLPMIQLDYRNLEQPLLPYYPRMHDARQVSDRREPIICIPTHSRVTHLPPHVRRVWERLWRPILSRFDWQLGKALFLSPCALPIKSAGKPYGKCWSKKETLIQAFARIAKEFIRGADVVTDMSLISYRECRAALADVRRRTANYTGKAVPVIFENHTKNLGNFAPLERFCHDLARADDVNVITATEAADRLLAGVYSIQSAGGETIDVATRHQKAA